MTRQIGMGLVAAAAMVVAVSAQSARPAEPAAPAAFDQLLAEVRELRRELNQAANAGIRTQLLVARLQLQEQRIDSVARQLVDTRQQLANADQARAAMAGPLTALAAGNGPLSDEVQQAVQPLKTMIAAGEKRADELRGQEAALEALLGTERSRWEEFNARLEDVERTLPRPAPR